jgi:hypothetical protein
MLGLNECEKNIVCHHVLSQAVHELFLLSGGGSVTHIPVWMPAELRARTLAKDT